MAAVGRTQLFKLAQTPWMSMSLNGSAKMVAGASPSLESNKRFYSPMSRVQQAKVGGFVVTMISC